ncbi:hypothetical protein SRHO_G00025880 [Serrasalmus rhombeus]
MVAHPGRLCVPLKDVHGSLWSFSAGVLLSRCIRVLLSTAGTDLVDSLERSTLPLLPQPLLFSLRRLFSEPHTHRWPQSGYLPISPRIAQCVVLNTQMSHLTRRMANTFSNSTRNSCPTVAEKEEE